jgi:N-acetylmuramoyl-L-alanine amidase
MTREEFSTLLENVYAPGGGWKPFIEVREDAAVIETRSGAEPYVLRFAATVESAQPASRFWRQRAQMPQRPATKPLQGVRIALDPGHIGGGWAKMEERWFQIGKAKPVTEGDMTLYVAKLLVPRLQALGAQVFLTRSKTAPVTTLRPDRLKEEAAAALRDRKEYASPNALKSEAEKLFYRVGEIRRRAAMINERIRPDIVLCLHFNAEAWGDEKNPTLTDKNHLHFLITGAFGGAELSYEDQRFNMLYKLLSRVYGEELAATEAVASAMAKETGLPPYVYPGGNAVRVGTGSYVWARNLLANRLYECPVVYVEPYVMNSREVFARLQAGDYKGKRNFGGKMRESIYREYANAIVGGLVEYYSMNP